MVLLLLLPLRPEIVTKLALKAFIKYVHIFGSLAKISLGEHSLGKSENRKISKVYEETRKPPIFVILCILYSFLDIFPFSQAYIKCNINYMFTIFFLSPNLLFRN